MLKSSKHTLELRFLVFIQTALIVSMYIQSYFNYTYVGHRCEGNYRMSEIQALQNFHWIWCNAVLSLRFAIRILQELSPHDSSP